jgi:hypothetical protein
MTMTRGFQYLEMVTEMTQLGLEKGYIRDSDRHFWFSFQQDSIQHH